MAWHRAVVIAGVAIAAFALMVWVRPANVESTYKMTSMEHVFKTVIDANVLDAFYVQSGMEPPMTPAHILEGLIIRHLDEVQTFTHIADDGAGGAFVQLVTGGIVLIDSEGEAAYLGRDLDEALAVLLSVSDWRDGLRVMSEITPDAARMRWDAYRAEWGLLETPQTKAGLRQLRETLGLSRPDDPFGLFYKVVQLGNALDIRNDTGAFQVIGRSGG